MTLLAPSSRLQNGNQGKVPACRVAQEAEKPRPRVLGGAPHSEDWGSSSLPRNTQTILMAAITLVLSPGHMPEARADLVPFGHSNNYWYETWNPTCGGSTLVWTIEECFLGMGTRYERFKQDDCWTARYGLTDYVVYYNWGYTWSGQITGIINGQTVNQAIAWYEMPPPPDFVPEIADVDWTYTVAGNTTVHIIKQAQSEVFLDPTWITVGTGRIVFQLSAGEIYFDEHQNELGSAWLDPRELSVRGHAFDCNGEASLFLPGSGDATPEVPVARWITYNLAANAPLWNLVSRAYHPNLSPQSSLQQLQAAFNAGSILLGTDDDACIADWDPAITPGDPGYSEHLRRLDDHCAYHEFLLSDASPLTFPPPFNAPEFLMPGETEVGQLLNGMTSAWIKQVESLPINVVGEALVGVGSMVITRDLNPVVLVHEWLHNHGVSSHRSDSGALMHEALDSAGGEVNRDELP